jgi:hypothetical protein
MLRQRSLTQTRDGPARKQSQVKRLARLQLPCRQLDTATPQLLFVPMACPVAEVKGQDQIAPATQVDGAVGEFVLQHGAEIHTLGRAHRRGRAGD